MCKDGYLPSYEDSIAGDDTKGKTPRGQRIIDQLTTVRTQHIRSIIDHQICPEVEYQADIGIARTILVLLLPANAPKIDADIYKFEDEPEAVDSGIELEGFPADDHVKIIQLEGKMNQASFWKQTGVREELRRVLLGKLSSLPQFQTQIPEPPMASVESTLPMMQKRRGLFRRFTDSIPRDSQPSMADHIETVSAEKIGVEIELDDGICQRTVSTFGLHETVRREALVVKVDAQL